MLASRVCMWHADSKGAAASLQLNVRDNNAIPSTLGNEIQTLINVISLANPGMENGQNCAHVPLRYPVMTSNYPEVGIVNTLL